MQTSRQNVQVWVISVVSGLVSAGLMTAFGLLDRPGSSPVRVALGGIVVGALVGAVVGWLAVRQRRVLSGVVGDVSPGVQQAATSAASRGPIPLDGKIRRAAARIAIHRLGGMAGNRRRGLITFGVLFVFYIYLAATSSPWWWAAAAAYLAVMSATQLWWPRHLQRRVDLLMAPDARA